MAYSELRVHGVSGTPPRELLYSDPVSYDHTDPYARVYETNRDGPGVKAFHWGSLTPGDLALPPSGSSSPRSCWPTWPVGWPPPGTRYEPLSVLTGLSISGLLSRPAGQRCSDQPCERDRLWTVGLPRPGGRRRCYRPWLWIFSPSCGGFDTVACGADVVGREVRGCSVWPREETLCPPVSGREERLS